MSANRWLKIWAVCALALGLGGATGCDDEDGEETSPATVVTTNVVGGTTVVVTNDAVVPDASGAAEQLAAQLVAPADGAPFKVFVVGSEAKVTFTWTPLAGVDSYTFRMGHFPGAYVFRENTATLEFPIGDYTWWIHGRYPVTADTVEDGPASEKRTFSVRQQTLALP